MKILFLGDSLIEYFDWNGRFPGHDIMNLGMAGETVQGLLSRVMMIRDSSNTADLVFIMTGINNVAMGDFDFINYYRVLLEKLKEACPGAAIHISSLLPADIEFIENAHIAKMNEELRGLADGRDVSYMDIHALFMSSSGQPVREYLTDDGVHISSDGYAVWSKAVEEVIEQHSIR